ncbi:hypothetical protein [Deinococcus humi]|uniref:Uncharacterized protein n=1 Tax=Deinococcus humi TaxID=662880 RepID=A0A7W8JYE1_9DEIO|nr:hypothetical protein [Deinococcus humi]MBB5363984.1 hypothetical protein [Deinococcus humi]
MTALLRSPSTRATHVEESANFRVIGRHAVNITAVGRVPENWQKLLDPLDQELIAIPEEQK